MEKAKPKLDALAAWMDAQLQLISGKGDLAKAIRYARSRWEALTCYCADGRLEISNNAAENTVRPISLGRKNWLFAGSDAGGERAAIFYTLVRSARMNGLEPQRLTCVTFSPALASIRSTPSITCCPGTLANRWFSAPPPERRLRAGKAVAFSGRLLMGAI